MDLSKSKEMKYINRKRRKKPGGGVFSKREGGYAQKRPQYRDGERQGDKKRSLNRRNRKGGPKDVPRRVFAVGKKAQACRAKKR